MTELTTGRNNFYMVGKVKINDNSLKDAEQKPGSSWLGVNTGFGLEIEEGNIIYPNIWGGRSLARGVLYGMNKETRKSVQIPFEDKNNETILDTLIPSNFRYAQIEKGDDGKLVEYRFLDDIDYVNYLQENLKHDMEVIVTGRATYSLGKPDEHGDMRIYKRYEISRVRLNETHEEDGEQVLNREHQASQNSTYLIDESALDKNWKKELENILTTSLPFTFQLTGEMIRQMEIIELVLFVVTVVTIGFVILHMVYKWDANATKKRVISCNLNAQDKLYFVEKAIMKIKEVPAMHIATALSSAIEEEYEELYVRPMYLTQAFPTILELVKGHPVYVEEYKNNNPRFTDVMWFPSDDTTSKLEVLKEYRKWLLTQINMESFPLN